MPTNNKEPKIPQHWDMEPLSVYVTKHNSGIYKNQKYYGRGENIVGVSDFVGVARIDGQEFARVPLNEDEKRKYTLREGDLLYCESSLVREGIARTLHVTKNGEGTAFAWHTRRYSVDRRKIHPGYLSYFFQSSMARSYLINNSIQTALTGINTRAYFDCPILIPPLEEQKVVAEALSDADALIEGLEKLIDKKRLIKQGAMQELLTGKRRLPGFSGEWDEKQLGEIFEITSSKRVFQNQWKPEGVPFFRAREIAELVEVGRVNNALFIDRSLYESFKASYGVPLVGDMLVTGVGTLGKAYVVKEGDEFYFKDGNIIWFKIHSKLCADFLQQLYLTPQIKEQITGGSSGTTVGTYTITAAKRTKIILPSISEQSAIATVLVDMDADISTYQAKLAKARQIKQGMMQELLTGRIRLV